MTPIKYTYWIEDDNSPEYFDKRHLQRVADETLTVCPRKSFFFERGSRLALTLARFPPAAMAQARVSALRIGRSTMSIAVSTLPSHSLP